MADARGPLGKARLGGAHFSRFVGRHATPTQRVLNLTRAMIDAAWRIKSVRRAIIVSFIPLVGFAIWAYGRAAIATLMGELSPEDYIAFQSENLDVLLIVQTACLLLLHAFTVAPAIVRDARSGALLLYFSRPIERIHYVVARILTGFALGCSVMIAPAVLLILIQWGVLTSAVGDGTQHARGAQSEQAAPVVSAVWQGHAVDPPDPLARDAVVPVAPPKGKLPFLGSPDRKPPVLDLMPVWAASVSLIFVSILAGAIASLGATLLGLLASVTAPTPGGASLAFGGSVMATWLVASVAKAALREDTIWRAASIHRMLRAPGELMLMAWSDKIPATADLHMVVAASAALVVLCGLAYWRVVVRIARPPRGEGRSG